MTENILIEACTHKATLSPVDQAERKSRLVRIIRQNTQFLKLKPRIRIVQDLSNSGTTKGQNTKISDVMCAVRTNSILLAMSVEQYITTRRSSKIKLNYCNKLNRRYSVLLKLKYKIGIISNLTTTSSVEKNPLGVR